MDSIEGVWLLNPKTGHINLVVHPETIQRCRSEGHTQVPDPRLPVEPVTEDTEAEPPMPLDASEEAVAPSEDEKLAEIAECNDAARAAFGIPTPPKRVGKGAAGRPGAVRHVTKEGA